jgi:hypothetical protein
MAGVSTVAFGAVAALSFGFGDTFFALDTGFTTFRATFFAAFAWTGGFLAVGAAVAFWRLGAAVGFVFFAVAFLALSSCQRLR